MSASELERARRELRASLALTRDGSPMRAPTEAQLSAIDAEVGLRAERLPVIAESSPTMPLAERASAPLRVCGCGMASDDDALIAGHLWEFPGHEERDLSRYIP